MNPSLQPPRFPEPLFRISSTILVIVAFALSLLLHMSGDQQSLAFTLSSGVLAALFFSIVFLVGPWVTSLFESQAAHQQSIALAQIEATQANTAVLEKLLTQIMDNTRITAEEINALRRAIASQR